MTLAELEQAIAEARAAGVTDDAQVALSDGNRNLDAIDAGSALIEVQDGSKVLLFLIVLAEVS